MGSRTLLGKVARRILRELLGILVPALLAGGILVALPQDSRSQGERGASSQAGSAAPLCGEWHRGSGETSPLDLDLVKNAYLSLRKSLTRSLARAKLPALPEGDPAYDAGLPACRSAEVREVPIPAPLGSRLRGKTLYFTAALDPVLLSLPPEVGGDPSALVLIMAARRLSDLPKIESRLGRPVSLGSRDLAKGLGVRCAGTWIRIDEKGDRGELHEAP